MFGKEENFYKKYYYKKMGYPKGYKAVHLNENLWNEINFISEFGNVGMQEKVKQLLRFYKAKRKIKNV